FGDGTLRRRQIDAAPHSRNARPRLERRIFFQRDRGSSFESERAGRASQRADRVCFSTISFARRSDGLRKPRDSIVLSKGRQERAIGDRGGRARSISDGGEKGFVSAPAFWRPTATRRRGARDHCQPETDSGGRADRKSSLQ